MGAIIGSGGKGNSESRQTANTSSSSTYNIDNRVYTSDFGAINAGTEVSREALDLGRFAIGEAADSFATAYDTGAELAGRGLDSAVRLGERSLDTVLDTSRDAFDFAGKSLDTVAQTSELVTGNALGFGGDVLDSAFYFGNSTVGTAFDFGRDALDMFGRLVGDTTSGLQSLSMQTSQSSDDRVAKIAMYAFGAMVAALVLPRVFSK